MYSKSGSSVRRSGALRGKPTRSIAAVGVALAILVGATACSDSAAPIVSVPTTLAIVAGNNQTATVGSTLIKSLSVEVRDQNGKLRPGSFVSFQAPNGGALTMFTAISDNEGIATVDYTLGTVKGAYPVIATIPTGTAPATFALNAVAGPPASLVPVQGDGQSGQQGVQLPSPFVALVLDYYGNPVEGAKVNWTVEGNATLSTTQSLTNASGVATVYVTVHSTGQVTVRASVEGGAVTSFRATGT